MEKKMISVTGGFLKGSIVSEGQFLRPDIITTFSDDGETVIMHHDICWMNKLGYIPLISSFTGVIRCLIAVVHIAFHLIRAIFEKAAREQHLLEVKLGLENLARGIIEIVPIAGNLTTGIIDLRRVYLRWKRDCAENEESQKKDIEFLKRNALGTDLTPVDQRNLRDLLTRAKECPRLFKLFNPELLKGPLNLFALAGV
jgi:hypothetical protein